MGAKRCRFLAAGPAGHRLGQFHRQIRKLVDRRNANCHVATGVRVGAQQAVARAHGSRYLAGSPRRLRLFVDAELLAQHGYVPGCLHVVEREFNFSVSVEDDSRTKHSLVKTPV